MDKNKVARQLVKMAKGLVSKSLNDKQEGAVSKLAKRLGDEYSVTEVKGHVVIFDKPGKVFSVDLQGKVAELFP